VKLEIQDLDAYNDTVTVERMASTKRSYSALIPVNQLITSVTLIATYNDGITRSSGIVKPIGT